MNSLYRELAQYYDIVVEPYVDTPRETRFLEKILLERKAKSVLDVGCGTGRHAIPLSLKGFRVTGIDSSAAMIRIAKQKALGQKSKCQFLRRDCRKIGLRDSFDAAYCMWNTFYVLPYRGFLKSLHKALRENGIFIIDGKDWELVRKNLRGKKEQVRENTLTKGKTEIKMTRTDYFTSTRRFVQTEYLINGKHFQSRELIGETIPIHALEKILTKYGFEVIGRYRDFRDWDENNSNSVQIVARKT